MAGRITYAAIMLAAVAIAGWLSRGRQVRLGLSLRQRLMIGLGGFTGAFLAAKLPFVLSYFVEGDWPAVFSGRALFSDGKTIMLGLAGGYFGVEAGKWYSGVKIGTGDSFAVAIPVAVAIGRLACFSNGCCHGVATGLPWGVDFGWCFAASDPDLRVVVPPGECRRPVEFASRWIAGRPSVQALPGCVLGFPVCDRVGASRGEALGWLDRLPVVGDRDGRGFWSPVVV